jgi:hypothetical protein
VSMAVKEYTWSAEDYGMRECERGGWVKIADYHAIVNKFLGYHNDDRKRIQKLEAALSRIADKSKGLIRRAALQALEPSTDSGEVK